MRLDIFRPGDAVWKRILHWEPGERLGRIILLAALLAGIAALFLTAWIGDDAFVTFRVVDNFVHGYGLRWNVHERVQAYTNPLWMFLHIPFYFFWPDIFHLTFILSYLCAAASIAVVALTFEKSPAVLSFYVIVPLLLARPWVEFAMSGLENPLSYLLFAWFGWLLVHAGKRYRWFWLSLAAGLAMLNRLDTGFLYWPPLLWQVVRDRGQVRWRQAALGFLPLAGWFAFSLFYYGFLFPNTKYAKINTGIAAMDYCRQGVHYFHDLLTTQMPAGVILLTGLAFGGWCGAQFFFTRHAAQERGTLFSVALGIATYCLYIIVVGGDFMSGRFFALPVFAAVWLLYAPLPPRLPLAYGVCLMACLLTIQVRFNGRAAVWHAWGIADERMFYQGDNALLRKDFSWRDGSEFPWMIGGLRLRNEAPREPIISGFIGMQGYFAGPQVTIVDYHALSDPLLARLPINDVHDWRIGHFARAIPQGYLYAVETGSTKRMDPNLARYYEKLRLITSGDLWDWERLETIIAFNLGRYDDFRDAYITSR